eukprot:1180741-Prorocentrum_minimum.AAC.5
MPVSDRARSLQPVALRNVCLRLCGAITVWEISFTHPSHSAVVVVAAEVVAEEISQTTGCVQLQGVATPTLRAAWNATGIKYAQHSCKIQSFSYTLTYSVGLAGQSKQSLRLVLRNVEDGFTKKRKEPSCT